MKEVGNKQEQKVLIWRCVFGTICFLFFTIAIEYLPLSIFFIIFNLVPFVSAVIAYFWLREKLSRFEIAVMILALVGVIMCALSKHDTEQDV